MKPTILKSCLLTGLAVFLTAITVAQQAQQGEEPTALPLASESAATTRAAPDCQPVIQALASAIKAGQADLDRQNWTGAVATLKIAETSAQPALASCTGAQNDEANARLTELQSMMRLAEDRNRRIKECSVSSRQASSADVKAAMAQAEKKESGELLKLYDEAARLWSAAIDQCDGPSRDRAQRNFADTDKARAAVAELSGAGPECETSHRGGASMQDLGKQAFAERRWGDAAMLFRKSASMYEMATEKCNGRQADAAQTKFNQVMIDAHNAEHCAPVFEHARDKAQAMKSASGEPLSARQDMSRAAEVAWREAAVQCKGSASDLAMTNAQRLSKERGTPLPDTVLAGIKAEVAAKSITPVVSAAPSAAVATVISANPDMVKAASAPAIKAVMVAAPTTASATTASAGSFAPRTSASPASDTATGIVGTIGALAKRVAAANDAPAAEPVAAKPSTASQPTEFDVNGARFSGVFARDANGTTYSGNGTIVWPNGDRYTGTLAQGKREGRGSFNWASGQTYSGEWNNDEPNGQGSLRFPNGDQYEGSVSRGMPHGTGSMRFAKGDFYSGDFRNGLQHGKGSFLGKNGDQYTGQWASGLKEGTGTYSWPSGDKWTGLFRKDVRTEEGTLLRASDQPKVVSQKMD